MYYLINIILIFLYLISFNWIVLLIYKMSAIQIIDDIIKKVKVDENYSRIGIIISTFVIWPIFLLILYDANYKGKRNK